MRTARWIVLAGLGVAAASLARAAEAPADLKPRIERFLVDHFRLVPPDQAEILSIWKAEPPAQWRFEVRLTRAGKTEQLVYAVTADLTTFALSRLYEFRDIRAENRAKIEFPGAPVRGSATAPVAIVAYCDLQCPDCAAAMAVLKRVLPQYEGKARLVFKNFPLMNSHPWAEAAALGARCAYEQKPEAFWALFDHFYEKQGQVSASNLREVVAEVGGQAGADRAALLACLDAKDTLGAVQRDVYEASKLGIRGTPTFLIDGRFVFSETLTEADFISLIGEAVKASQSR